MTNEKSVVVFAGTIWQAEMVKSLLGNAGIEAYIKDGYIGTIGPWWSSPGGAGAVKVVVFSKDLELAEEIVKEYELNNKADEE